jgi:hypothetical protein
MKIAIITASTIIERPLALVSIISPHYILILYSNLFHLITP